jgi:hypothetical protein
MNLNEQQFLESFKKRIIKETVKKICKTYTIFDDDENEIYEEEIIKSILQPKIIKRCVGTTKGTPVSQCNRHAIEGYDYCKSHLHNICLQESNDDNCNLLEITFTQNKLNKNIDESELQKVFIEDSFYFVDNKYIYDNKNIKVGYILNKDFILTSDPFILETI